MLTNKSRLKPLWWLGRSVMPLLLALVFLLVMLGGCASKQPTLAVDCPQPVPVPATLKESSLPDAQTLSSEAKSWFDEVSSFLSGLR